MIFNRGGKDGVGEIHLASDVLALRQNRDGYIDESEWEATLKTPFNNSLLAIRPGGLKDISATHVVWQAKQGVPEVPSPLLLPGLHLHDPQRRRR